MLTDAEKSLLRAFADNPGMMSAVSKVLFDAFEMKDGIAMWVGNRINLSDVELGQIVRARLEGIGCLNKGFNTIAAYATPVHAERSRTAPR